MSRSRLFACTILSLLVSTSVFAVEDSTRTPLLHEDIWLMKRVGGPVPSPDGKWVVCAVTEPSYDDKEQRSDLWIMSADGKAKPRQLTFSLSGEGGVAWSPDSRKIAFSAKREGDEAAQIYILNVAEGGEAIRTTNISTGARSPQWRPDGNALLFSSSVYPGAVNDSANKKIAADRKARKYKARVYEGFPIRSWDKWLDDMQPHLFVMVLGDGTAPRDILAGTSMVNEPGFNAPDDLHATWTPDGTGVIFVATPQNHLSARAFVNSHLYHLSINGGEPELLTPDNGSYSYPLFSPDGSSLYAVFSPTNTYVYTNNRLVKLRWPRSGGPAVLTETFDRSVGSYAITPDGTMIYLLAEEAGHEKLYSLPSSGGTTSLVFEMNSGVYSNLRIPARASSTLLLALWENAATPAEVVRIEPKKKNHVALTEFNTQKARALNLPSLRHFWFTGTTGTRIHNMLVVPRDFDPSQSYPLVAMIHGGPHSMWRDYFFLRWNYHLLADPGFVMLLTDYTGSTGYGEKFAQSIQGDPFVGPARDILEGIDEAIRLYNFIDTTHIAAIGASYGGHMVNWLQGTSDRFRCFVSHAGLINLESQWGTSDGIYHREVNNGGPVWEQGGVWRTQNPARYAMNFKTPVMVTIGENDFRVPLNQSIEYWSYLQRLQVPSRFVVFPEANHWIMKGEDSRYFYSEVHSWLKKYLKN